MGSWVGLFVALSPFWTGLEPGDFDVGYEHAALRDYARPFRVEGEDRARPIELSIWYPAHAREDAEPLPFRRYVEHSDRDALVLRLGASGHRLSETDVERIVSAPTGAFERAPHMPGPFPLLVFGTGLTAPAYLNTVLAEYLASHGYVVVAIPSIAAREDVRPDFDALAVETQLRDMEFVIHWMHDYPETDIERLGLVAWGFGGVAQALLQMKNADVGAVVSLDGATGYAYGSELLKTSIYFEPTRATAPFFHVTDSRDQTHRVSKRFDYYDSTLRGPSMFLTVEDAAHAELVSLTGVVPHALLPNASSPDVRRRYALVCRYVESFLSDTMKGDSDAADFLDVTPSRHGFDGLILSRRR